MSTTDTPVAYTQAVDQLRARAEAAENERDALRAQIQNGDYLLRPAPPTISEVMLQGALGRAEAAEKEREEWERSHGEVVDVIGVIAAALQVTRGGKDSLEDWTGRITAALGELRTQLEAVTADRDDMAQKFAHGWIEREVDARLMADLEMQTGPVAFERNQLRDELAELRPQVDDLRAKFAAAESRAAMYERDADEAGRAVTVLSTIIRASVEAIARGVK